MSTNLKIAIAEPSVIIRSGLENLLKRLPGFRIQMVEIHSVESLFDSLRMHKPDVLIVNPALPGYFTLQHLKEESGKAEMKCIALLYSVLMMNKLYRAQWNGCTLLHMLICSSTK